MNTKYADNLILNPPRTIKWEHMKAVCDVIRPNARLYKVDGWNLENTIIWYKPNHMPAPVKNRLTNTYEPIFVLSRNKRNYYTEYKQKLNVSELIVQSIVIILLITIGSHLIYYNPTNMILTLLGLAFVILSVFMYCYIGWCIIYPKSN